MTHEEDRRPANARPLHEAGRRSAAAAIRHDGEAGNAPELTAAGFGANARQILETAFAHGVPVREDAALAESLAALDAGGPLPAEVLIPVAEILAYLYRLDAHGGRMPPEPAP